MQIIIIVFIGKSDSAVKNILLCFVSDPHLEKHPGDIASHPGKLLTTTQSQPQM